jgi:hypothetical protein
MGVSSGGVWTFAAGLDTMGFNTTFFFSLCFGGLWLSFSTSTRPESLCDDWLEEEELDILLSVELRLEVELGNRTPGGEPEHMLSLP